MTGIGKEMKPIYSPLLGLKKKKGPGMLSVAHTLIYSEILDSSLHPPVPQCPCISDESNSNCFLWTRQSLKWEDQ